MFLHCMEEFHLNLAVEIRGSTISIGGEKKKAKISSDFSDTHLDTEPALSLCQGTENATKWNECLSPSLFAFMHKYFFCPELRTKLGIKAPSEYGILFSKIAVTGNFFMACKEIQLGMGLQIQNDDFFSRMRWEDEFMKTMSESTRKWYNSVRDLISNDRQFLKTSPGMLMGMLNAGSTTVGLLAVNHRMDNKTMRVSTLRSSDDSMSLYMANCPYNSKWCIHINKRNLEMLGINLSPDKTFFFVAGYGEYTSWYMDNKFTAQYGVETSSIRPQGKNPAEDFYAVAKGTSTSFAILT